MWRLPAMSLGYDTETLQTTHEFCKIDYMSTFAFSRRARSRIQVVQHSGRHV